MYITLNSVKRNLGFKGLEINDFIIAFPFALTFLVLFCCTRFKLFSLSILITGIFALIPVNVSQKNRMYKVFFLVIKYLFSIKEYTYYNLGGKIAFEKIKDKRRKRKEKNKK